jgi:Protein of unknown function (DUF3309)
MLGTVLIVILILALLGALPRWPHSRNWGYAPTGGLALILIIVAYSSASRPDLTETDLTETDLTEKDEQVVTADRSWRALTPALACSFV